MSNYHPKKRSILLNKLNKLQGDYNRLLLFRRTMSSKRMEKINNLLFSIYNVKIEIIKDMYNVDSSEG